MSFDPQHTSQRQRINSNFLPPRSFVAVPIRWSARELATKTEVGVTTIRRAELTASETKLTRVNDQAIRRVLEAAGVEFIDENGGGPGVRLRDVQQQES
jgi:hypothetical protein